jgi:hypothetical protein
LLLDLITIRIVEPASKLRSIELSESYFGIKHRRQSYYQFAPQWLPLKEEIESIVVAFAKSNYAFDFDLLFYDVTTLYLKLLRKTSYEETDFPRTTNHSNYRFWSS